VGPEIFEFEFSKKHFSAAARNTLAAHCNPATVLTEAQRQNKCPNE
jgi:hypothetical protein